MDVWRYWVTFSERQRQQLEGTHTHTDKRKDKKPSLIIFLFRLPDRSRSRIIWSRVWGSPKLTQIVTQVLPLQRLSTTPHYKNSQYGSDNDRRNAMYERHAELMQDNILPCIAKTIVVRPFIHSSQRERKRKETSEKAGDRWLVGLRVPGVVWQHAHESRDCHQFGVLEV